MLFEISTCTECGEGIQEPLCPHCVMQGVEGWLKKVKPRSVPELRRISEEFFLVPENESQSICIKCYESFGVCCWCYLEAIQEWIRTLRKPLREEFNSYYGLNKKS